MKKLFSVALALLVFGLQAGCEGFDVYFTTETPLVTLIIQSGESALEVDHALGDDEEKTLFDILLEHFDVDYDLFDFGDGEMPMLTRIECLDTPYGSFISIDINGEFAMKGIAELPYEAGDVVTFSRAWWDPLAESVYEGIEAFKAHSHAETYLYAENGAHMEVALALRLSGDLDAYVATHGVNPYDRTPETMSEYVRAVFTHEVFGIDAGAFAEALEGEAEFGWPYMNALMMLALAAGGIDNKTLKDGFIADLQARDLSHIDLDTLSLVLLALSLDEGPVIEGLIDDILDVVTEELYHSSFGNNAATFAHVIIALIAVGEDPRDARYAEGETSLVSMFLEYMQEDGSFLWRLDDEEADLMFSTPQGFLALVCLHTYFNSAQPINPYRFD